MSLTQDSGDIAHPASPGNGCTEPPAALPKGPAIKPVLKSPRKAKRGRKVKGTMGPDTSTDVDANDSQAKSEVDDAEGSVADTVPSRKLGSAKAVETMFRNAVRAELDLIALAATKANIMISLNGFIISALMISGAFLFNSSPVFLVPAGVFMLTSAASIVFALLSASPERASVTGVLRDWMVDLRHRRARLRDLRIYLRRAQPAADSDEFNVLIYSDRSRLSRAETWERMQFLLQDREEIYRRMTDHLHWLGRMASHKFRLLDVSYTVFRWGLLASVMTFMVVRLAQGLLSGAPGDAAFQLRNLGISEFQDVYEPSAVQQLPDGMLLVVEDEAKRAISLLSLAPDGTLSEDRVADLRMMRGFGRKLSDLEGLSIDDTGFVYAITSHSMTNDNERKPDREQLLRFRVRAGTVGDVVSYGGLRDALAGDAGLAAAIRDATGQVPDFSRLNIEGLSYHDVNGGRLMLGLREPMVGSLSLIVVIENAAELFDPGAAPRFGLPILLDLRGGGIRALSHDPVLEAFLIVNEIEGHEGNRYSQLWIWSGDPAMPPDPVALPDIINLNNVESIDSILVQGEPRLLIMSDEGDPKKDRPAKYMMLDYGQLGS